MSLIFTDAIETFDVRTAVLAAPEPSAVSGGESRVPMQGVVEHARRHDSLTHPQRSDWTCLPLHRPDTAALTGGYVAYVDHDFHGEVVVYRVDGPGDDVEAADYDHVDLDTFATSELARRVRFWHADYVPETDPDYYTAPLRDREPPRHPVDPPSTFFEELRSYVDRERAARREANRERVAGRSPAALFEAGEDAIPALRSRGRADAARGSYSFELAFGRIPFDTVSGDPPSGEWSIEGTFGVYEGNEALLVPPGIDRAPEAFPLVVTVETVRGSRVDVRVDWANVDDPARVRRFLDEDRVGFGLVHLLNDVPFAREETAVDRLQADDRLEGALTGRRPIRFDDPVAAETARMDDELNQEQRVAVDLAMRSDSVFCVQGPPGTGKTRTLVEIVRRSVTAGQSVLVCADSNQAVDNLAVGDTAVGTSPDEGSLHAYAQAGADEFTMVRHNARRSTNDLVGTRYRRAVIDDLPDVVLSTNSSAATLDRRFDVVVVDEATQSTMTASCIALSKAKKAVLAGDHRQLPPFSASEAPPDSAAGLSLFEHLYADGGVFEGVGVQLRTQYRMHRDIAYFPNRRFYDRSLRHGRDVDPLASEALGGVAPGTTMLAYDVGGGERRVGHSYANDSEARLTTVLVERLVGRCEVDPTDVGVVAAYRAQVDRIETALRERGGLNGVTVDTIDAFQGSEREVVLVSLTRSNADGRVGFLGRPTDGPRRLNVAMTRAKRLCVLVGDWSTLRASAGNERTADLFEDLHSYLADSGRVNRVDPAFL